MNINIITKFFCQVTVMKMCISNQHKNDYYLESNFLKSSLDILVTLDSFSTCPESLPGAS